MAKILVVDDESDLLYSFELFLTRRGHEVSAVGSAAEALGLLSEDVDLVITDIVLKGESGLDLLDGVRSSGLSAPVVMMTGQPGIESASEAVRLGAFEYLRKPVDRDRLYQVVDRALAYKELSDRKEALERENASMRARLEAIFNSVTEAIAVVDRDLRFLKINHACAGLPGFDPDGYEGRSMESDVSSPVFRAVLASVKAALKAQSGFSEKRVECRGDDGGERIFAACGSPFLDGDGTYSGLVLTFRDVTRVEQLEGRVRSGMRHPGIIGESAPMAEVYDLIDDLLDTETTVLVTGESGTGKELVADALHMGGPRRSAPLVKVNCSALSESILESELFGHVRGSFTGALNDREGRFQMAEGGTLFLDEIGDISPAVQLKLLRVLQDKQFERVGDNRIIRADVRVVAATNRKLSELVDRGIFRQDLYYRLKVVEVALPPLRERGADLGLLVDYFRTIFNRRLGKDISGVSAEASARFEAHSWPGNVRELQHAVEHACIRCRGETITLRHLPPEIRNLSAPGPRKAAGSADLAEVLAACGGNKSKAAGMLGISRPTLYRRIREAGLDA